MTERLTGLGCVRVVEGEWEVDSGGERCWWMMAGRVMVVVDDGHGLFSFFIL